MERIRKQLSNGLKNKMYEIWSVVFLLVCAIADYKTKEIYVWFCLLNYFLAIVMKVVTNNLKLENIIIGIIVCTLLYIIALVTKEAVGVGDILIILTLTAMVELKVVLNVMMIAFIISAIFSIIGVSIGKMSLKTNIPFVPFIFCGNILFYLCKA